MIFIKNTLKHTSNKQTKKNKTRKKTQTKPEQNSFDIKKDQSIIIGTHYKLEKKIGQGNFGIIYQGTNIKTKEMVAIKFESHDSKIRLLKYETNMIDYLSRHKCPFIPCIYWYGLHTFTKNIFDNDNDCHIHTNKKYTCFIQPFYEGGSLFENQHFIENIEDIEFRIYCIHYIMKQMINIIKHVHSFGVLHRDIKPHNFMFLREWTTLFISNTMTKKEETIVLPDVRLIDFGFAIFENKEIENNEKENNENDKKTNHSIIGTPNYTSYFVNRGEDFQRRDDLISIGYIYLFLLWNTLPWVSKKEEPMISFEQTEHLKEWSVLSSLIKSTVLYDGKFYINKSFNNNTLDPFQNQHIHSIFLYMKYCYSLSKRDKIFYDDLIKLMSITSNPLPEEGVV